jgi:hypothetical protein
MVSAEKIKKIVLPSVLVMGLGILEIKYPHAMTSFDDNYTGRGISGFIRLHGARLEVLWQFSLVG